MLIDEITVLFSKNYTRSMTSSSSKEKFHNKNIKLSKHKIQNFNGNTDEQFYFWTIFERNIHLNQNLNNYERNIRLLKDYFGEKNNQIRSHYLKFSNIKRSLITKKFISNYLKI